MIESAGGRERAVKVIYRVWSPPWTSWSLSLYRDKVDGATSGSSIRLGSRRGGERSEPPSESVFPDKES